LSLCVVHSLSRSPPFSSSKLWGFYILGRNIHVAILTVWQQSKSAKQPTLIFVSFMCLVASIKYSLVQVSILCPLKLHLNLYPMC
ncbi:hypothetical protein ABN254_21545, partial [Providencia rettgeri]